EGGVVVVVAGAAPVVGQFDVLVVGGHQDDAQVAVVGVGDVHLHIQVRDGDGLADGDRRDGPLEIADVHRGVTGKRRGGGSAGNGEVDGVLVAALTIGAVLVLVHRVAGRVSDVWPDRETVAADSSLRRETHVELLVARPGHGADREGRAGAKARCPGDVVGGE